MKVPIVINIRKQLLCNFLSIRASNLGEIGMCPLSEPDLDELTDIGLLEVEKGTPDMPYDCYGVTKIGMQLRKNVKKKPNELLHFKR